MLGWRLFVRALTLLIDNIGVALRVSLVPYALVVAATLWLVSSYGVEGLTSGGAVTFDPANPDAAMPESGLVFGTFLVSALSVIVTLWIAVGWHRFVLLDERPAGVMPRFHGGRVLAYLGWSILIGLLVALVAFAVSMLFGVVLITLVPGGLAGLLLGAASLFVSMILFYRLAVKLPAVAIGREMTFGEAWAATRGHSGTVVVLALLTVAFSILLQVPTMLDGGGVGGFGAVTVLYQLVVQWFATLLGVGTLTALYGHLVEGRPV